MLAESRSRILETLPDDALVLDVGGWAQPLSRADWVIDLMPYATRGLYGDPDPNPERFTDETWVTRDICEHEPWPFSDGEFDFAVCSHTLEDVRDPVWVCSELNRVARAGYVEVPSRLDEQTFGVHGAWVGWSHHRWLTDISQDRIEFVFKPHLLQGVPEFQIDKGFRDSRLPQELVSTMFWEGQFEFSERIFFEPEDLHAYLGEPVPTRETARPSRGMSLRARVGRKVTRK